MVADNAYPCVGAKSVFARGQVELLVCDRLADPDDTPRLRSALAAFSRAHPRDVGDGQPQLASFSAVFRDPIPSTELEFENLLWRQLALLRAGDDNPWDRSVSSDPADPHFGFSVAGRAFFVIGMHPAASRTARRSPLPVLVFNPHSQFEQLRATGRYDRIRDVVRTRDTRLQGCINPMVADHGSRSEACQYSGRTVPADWRPPHIPQPDPADRTTQERML
jgi:FPC/CPF motif-containing protein YcgG